MAKMLTIKEVAEKLNITGVTVRRRIESGEVKAIKLGGEWRVDEDWLDAYISGVEGTEPIKNTRAGELRNEIDEANLERELGAAKRGLTVEQLDDLQIQLTNEQTELVKKEAELAAKEAALTEQSNELRTIESGLRQACADFEVEQEKWRTEIREGRSRFIQSLEILAHAVYSHPQYNPPIRNDAYGEATREFIIERLEPVLELSGIKVELDKIGEYVELHMRKG